MAGCSGSATKTSWSLALIACASISGCAVDMQGQESEVALEEEALTVNLFTDNFDSSSVGLNNWTVSGCVRTGDANSNSGGSSGVRCDDASSITQKVAVNTAGYTNITVSYQRRTNSYDSGEYLRAEWSSGSSWSLIEQATNTSFAAKSFSVPAGTASVRLRFTANITGSGFYERFDIDDIKVTGDSGSSCTPSCSGAECGSNGCGGSCGTCGGGESCQGNQCVPPSCTPSCAGKTCGDNGCGGSCGSCGAGQSCSAGMCVAPPPATNPGNFGPYTICNQTSSLNNSGYASAIVSYPCEATGRLPATTLTGGYTNTKEDMYWLKDHVVSHGYIVIAMTPTNTLGNTDTWKTAHLAGHAKLLSENTRSGSTINGRVDTARTQIMGFSKGGGGTLKAANTLGTNIKTAQALAPWLESTSNSWSGIRAATVLHTGTSDSIAPSSKVKTFYTQLPTTISRSYIKFNGVSHGVWYSGNSSERTRLKTQIVAWMKVYLTGDTTYRTYLDGAAKQTNANAGWFSEYLYVP